MSTTYTHPPTEARLMPPENTEQRRERIDAAAAWLIAHEGQLRQLAPFTTGGVTYGAVAIQVALDAAHQWQAGRSSMWLAESYVRARARVWLGVLQKLRKEEIA